MSESEIARELVDNDDVRAMLKSAKAGSDEHGEPSEPIGDAAMVEPFKFARRADAQAFDAEADALTAFRVAARSLKAAEVAFVDAQQVYADAVRRLSEEAVK
jgi:hypothetical protein